MGNIGYAGYTEYMGKTKFCGYFIYVKENKDFQIWLLGQGVILVVFN